MAARRLWLSLLLLLAAAPLAAAEPQRLTVIGGDGGLPVFARTELPFWRDRVPALTGGRVQPDLVPIERSGARREELLKMVRLGVVSIATVPFGMAAVADPEIGALDLPMLSTTYDEVRDWRELWRPQIDAMLRDRYDVELLGIYVYAPQVVFCRDHFASWEALAGRRIRTSSIAQGEWVEGMRGLSVIVPFNEMLAAMRNRVTDCAITGIHTGLRVGLQREAPFMAPVPVNWLSAMVVANRAALQRLDAADAGLLRQGVVALQDSLLAEARRETADALECLGGGTDCPAPYRVAATVVRPGWSLPEQHRILSDIVLPAWLARCGAACVEQWNQVAAPRLHIWLAE